MMINRELIKKLESYCRLKDSKLHGAGHWVRVHRFGKLLSDKCNLRPELEDCVETFSLTHDLARNLDGFEEDHGGNSALLFNKIRNELFPDLSNNQVEVIKIAIHYHSDGMTSEEAYYKGLFDHIDLFGDDLINTIGCCWDADRLDLLRLGRHPRPELMSTEHWEDVLPLAEKIH